MCRIARPISSAWMSSRCAFIITSSPRRLTSAMSEAYTPQELMVAVASREIRDGDLVFVGMRLPILAYAVARNAHAPSARGLFEVGLMRDQPAAGFLGPMGDPDVERDGADGAGARRPRLHRRGGGRPFRQPEHIVRWRSRETEGQAAGERGRSRHRDPQPPVGDADEPRTAPPGRKSFVRHVARLR